MKSLNKSRESKRFDSHDSTYYTQDSDNHKRSVKKLYRSRGRDRSNEYLKEESDEEVIYRIKKNSKDVS